MAFTDPRGKPTLRGFACMLLQGGCSLLDVPSLVTLDHVTLWGTDPYGDMS